ncbi:ribbon-helix-helix protein, CopG family [Massilia scottii]|uniref:ribbon-helix-helix protein, CopG family n=1 Tax=Massilia scottii TaxID=3057166 RepID=UPI002796D110|nr:ribbon-helix-helix protein, CopG family [Massilia sp. CCM 9029]MDQ1830744.1 ribbon-helix-helix protein, CopG family [Massilia sp. CCM 9029]
MSNTVYKTSFALSEDDFKMLEELAASRGVTKGDIVRQALSDFNFFQEMREKGGHILIEDKDRKLSKVIFP